MNKIQKAFKNGKAFIGFVTAGDPDLETSEKILLQMAKGGCDLIEIGIPFSDPIAEGPIIQAANIRSLAAGTTTDRVFHLAKRLSGQIDTPLVFMTYLNVLFRYGYDLFLEKAQKSGISGVIVPDLPFEEKEELASVARKYDIAVISLIAPTSKTRIERIAQSAEGFLYAVSSMGVTGVRSEIQTDLGAMTKAIRKATELPVAIGFGIGTPKQAAAFAPLADGIIVGSAIVKLVEKYGKDAPDQVYTYVQSMKNAIRNL